MTMEHCDNEFTMIFYLIDAANSGKGTIRVLREDTDVFVLLVCWVYREEMECKVQMERWDMTMLGHSVCRSIACRQQLPHDLRSMRQGHDQCAKQLVH